MVDAKVERDSAPPPPRRTPASPNSPDSPDSPGRSRRPPGPRGRLFVGNGRAYDRDRIGFLLRCQRDYGDVFGFSDISTVVLDPELIHRLHQRTNEEFLTEAPIFSDPGVLDRLAAAVPDLMTARRKGWHGVDRTTSKAHTRRLLAAFDRTLDTACRRSADEGEIDVLPVMKGFSGLAVADYCLGADSDVLPSIVAAVDAGVAAALVQMDRGLRLPSWLPTPGVRRFARTSRHLADLLRAVVANRRAAVSSPPEEPRDLLDTLLGPSGPALEDRTIVRILNIMLRASYGVPGAALAFAVREFARQPRLVERLRAEVPDELDASTDLPYAEAVVKELLRAHPPTWLGGREVRAQTLLGGWDLEPGQQVMFSSYIVHRDPRWWDAPAEFRPERWLGTTAPHTRHAYFPFGAGPRICLGNQLGMRQLTLSLARLVQSYDLTVSDPESAVDTPQALLVPKGLRARFSERAW